MNILQKAKQEHPELFEEQICKICGKRFYLTKCQIRNKYRKLLNNQMSFICCCPSHTTKFQLSVQGNPYSKSEVIEKRQNKLLLKYGVKHNSQIPGRREKVISKCLSNIDENGLNSYQRGVIKGLKTKLSNIDENGLNSIQRGIAKSVETKRNTIDENGLNINQKAAIKSKETKLKNHGDPNYNNTKQAQKTSLERHGKVGYNNRKLCAETKLKNHGDEKYNNRELAKITFNQNWGVDNISQTEYWKNIIKSKQKEIQKKIYNTKKKNGTLNSSNSEDMIYQFLIYKFEFEDVIYHYYDEKRYPFECDFYIKSLDLFIEINFFWTHGFKPFDKNNIKHIEQLNKWIKDSQDVNFKQKKKDGYKNAIYIWTIDDPHKLEVFKKNNLNYEIFYNLEEFLDWFDAVNSVNFNE